MQPLDEEACSWVMKECLGMFIDFTKLRSTDTRKRLAGRTSHDNVEGFRGTPETKLPS